MANQNQKPTEKAPGTMMEWRCVWKGDEPQAQAEPGVRSSHGITADAGNVYLFGGERVARVPVDNAVYRLNLKVSERESHCKNAMTLSPFMKCAQTSPIPYRHPPPGACLGASDKLFTSVAAVATVFDVPFGLLPCQSPPPINCMFHHTLCTHVLRIA
jgi:hypothetical protein